MKVKQERALTHGRRDSVKEASGGRDGRFSQPGRPTPWQRKVGECSQPGGPVLPLWL